MWGEILKGLLKEGKELLDTMITESERKVKQLNNTNNKGGGGKRTTIRVYSDSKQIIVKQGERLNCFGTIITTDNPSK